VARTDPGPRSFAALRTTPTAGRMAPFPLRGPLPFGPSSASARCSEGPNRGGARWDPIRPGVVAWRPGALGAHRNPVSPCRGRAAQECARRAPSPGPLDGLRGLGGQGLALPLRGLGHVVTDRPAGIPDVGPKERGGSRGGGVGASERSVGWWPDGLTRDHAAWPESWPPGLELVAGGEVSGWQTARRSLRSRRWLAR